MPLVFVPGGKERTPCETVLKPDYKDDFYWHGKYDGRGTIVFPNEKEKAAYKYNPSDYLGLIDLKLYHSSLRVHVSGRFWQQASSLFKHRRLASWIAG